jgi:hypothetical protein
VNKLKTIVVISIILLSFNVCAKESTNKILFASGLTIASFFSHTALHESFHALATKAMGGEIFLFKPCPHMYDNKLFFGRVESEELSMPKNIFILSAPYLMDVSIFFVSDMLLKTNVVNPKSYGGISLYVIGMVAPFIDFTYNFIRGVDWEYFRNTNSAVSITSSAIGITALIIGTYQLITRYMDVFR